MSDDLIRPDEYVPMERDRQIVEVTLDAQALLAERRRYEVLRDGVVVHVVEDTILDALKSVLHYVYEFAVGWKAEIRDSRDVQP